MHQIHSGRGKCSITDLASCGYLHISIHDNTSASSPISVDHTVHLHVKASSTAAGEFPRVFTFKEWSLQDLIFMEDSHQDVDFIVEVPFITKLSLVFTNS